MQGATRERFAKTAERVAALQDARAAELEQKVVRFVAPTGDEDDPAVPRAPLRAAVPGGYGCAMHLLESHVEEQPHQ